LLSPDESSLAPPGLVSPSVFAISVLAASAVMDSAFVASILAPSAVASVFALSGGSAALATTELTWDGVGSGAGAEARSGRSVDATGAGGTATVTRVANGSAVPGSLGAVGVALLTSSGGVPLGDSKIGSRLT
jgi:hypothetical protein